MEYSAEVTHQPGRPADYAPGATWRVVGAAAAGLSHLRQDLPCQDEQAACISPAGYMLVALADGAGSARFSDQGAARAVEAALAVLAAGIDLASPAGLPAWELLARSALATARQAVLQLAEQAQESPREYACTLTCVAASGSALMAAQVGDGAVVGMDGEGSLFSGLRLQRGEYANETHFITQDDALVQASFVYTQCDLRGVAVMSDGLIRLALKMPSQEPHEPFFQPLFRFAQAAADSEDSAAQLAAFLMSDRVNQRTDDDKSLVLAVRTNAPDDQARPSSGAPPKNGSAP